MFTLLKVNGALTFSACTQAVPVAEPVEKAVVLVVLPLDAESFELHHDPWGLLVLWENLFKAGGIGYHHSFLYLSFPLMPSSSRLPFN